MRDGGKTEGSGIRARLRKGAKARRAAPSPEQLRILARYLPGEFRGDWDPFWGHPLDRPENEEIISDLQEDR